MFVTAPRRLRFDFTPVGRTTEQRVMCLLKESSESAETKQQRLFGGGGGATLVFNIQAATGGRSFPDTRFILISMQMTTVNLPLNHTTAALMSPEFLRPVHNDLVIYCKRKMADAEPSCHRTSDRQSSDGSEPPGAKYNSSYFYSCCLTPHKTNVSPCQAEGGRMKPEEPG